MLQFTQLSGFEYDLEDLVGFIPEFLSEDDPAPAKEQIDRSYQHGGGWRRFEGFVYDPLNKSIKYPDDPVMYPWAEAKLRDELILVYPSAWVCIVQPDGSYEIARID